MSLFPEQPIALSKYEFTGNQETIALTGLPGTNSPTGIHGKNPNLIFMELTKMDETIRFDPVQMTAQERQQVESNIQGGLLELIAVPLALFISAEKLGQDNLNTTIDGQKVVLRRVFDEDSGCDTNYVVAGVYPGIADTNSL